MTFAPLSEAEAAWLADQNRFASMFVGQTPNDSLPSLQALDDAFAKFTARGSQANEDANAIVLCVGVAFGEHLVRSLGFEWCICTDEWGTDIAVRARPGRGDCTVFPTNFVAKRWERKETNFLVASLLDVSTTLRQYAIAWGEEP